MSDQAQLAFSGLEVKRQVLDSFEGSPWLVNARRVAAEICKEKGFVTSDDVIERIGLPVGRTHNLVGALFHKGFYLTGYTQTKRKVGHARRIGQWKVAP